MSLPSDCAGTATGLHHIPWRKQKGSLISRPKGLSEICGCIFRIFEFLQQVAFMSFSFILCIVPIVPGMMAVRMSPFLSVTLDFSVIYSAYTSKGVSPGRKTVLRLDSIRDG
jgi:hypothetical protein